MMKILVVSDTHGYMNHLEAAVEAERPFDMLFHCGDIEGQEHEIRELAGVPCHMVTGNNDWSSNLPPELTVNVGGCHFWISHGHRYGVSLGPERIREEAEFRGVDVCLYGHTHRPLIETKNGCTVMNPGSLTYPRQIGHLPSYGVITLDDEKKLRFEIKYFE